MQIQFQNINYDQPLEGGWTVKDVIEDMEGLLAQLMACTGFKPITNKTELIYWLRDNYPILALPWKPHGKILPVEEHFCRQYGFDC